MFLRNDSDLDVRLARGLVYEEMCVLAVGAEATYAVSDDWTLERVVAPAKPSDPPDPRARVLWRDTSVTVGGQVPGPEQSPFARLIRLTVGEVERRLAVFGERRWERRGGTLVASEPLPFDALELSWRHAFGGSYRVEPGYDPRTGLPRPGATLAHPQNPHGTGYYPDAEAAVARPLPRVEDPQRLVHAWDDAPTPVGFAPCPELAGLRLHAYVGRRAAQGSHDGFETELRESLHACLWLQHHAPPELIFPELAARTPVVLEGMGAPMRLVLPPCPGIARVVIADGGRQELRPRLRSVHLDADARTARLAWSFGHRYQRARPPHWILAGRAA